MANFDLMVAWQNTSNRQWIPVGRLSHKKEQFIFEYTHGAETLFSEKKFIPFGNMTDIHGRYESNELFPIFKNRLLTKSRPEYKDYVKWLGLTEDNIDPFLELSRTGGIRATDQLQVFPIPKVDKKGMYSFIFFGHGIRHLPKHYIERVHQLKVGDPLYLMKDCQNPKDPHALALRTVDPLEVVGYTPRFLSDDFTQLIDLNGPNQVKTSVFAINLDSPIQYRLLCKIETHWPKQFKAFSHKDFETVN